MCTGNWSTRPAAVQDRRDAKHGRSGCESAVDGQAGAGHKSGFRPCQIADQSSDLVDVAVAGESHELLEHLGKFAFRRIHIGVDGTWLNVVNGNSARTEVSRE